MNNFKSAHDEKEEGERSWRFLIKAFIATFFFLAGFVVKGVL